MKVLQEFPEVELYWLLNGKGNFPTTPSNEIENYIPKKNKLSNKLEENLKSEKVNDSIIERIVVFFKDGSFKSYQ
jgi:hypothetical protein